MIRFGLAGVGIHGSRYAAHLLAGDVPGASLVAVSRANEAAGKEFAGRHGIAFERGAEALVRRGDVDAVIAVLPPDLHPGVVDAALGAGRPVLVEKPLAADAARAGAVAARARGAGVPVMVAHTLRFDPLLRRMREEAASLGPLRMVAINQRFEPTSRPWIDTPGRGGAILNTGVHGFDLLRFLTGLEPASVVAETSRFVTRDTEDEFAAVFRLEPGGVLATVDNARTTRGRSGRVEIAAEGGQIRGDHIHRTLVRIDGRYERDLGPVPPVATVVEALRAFVACVLTGAQVPVTVDDGWRAVRMADAVRRSAASGARVPIES